MHSAPQCIKCGPGSGHMVDGNEMAAKQSNNGCTRNKTSSASNVDQVQIIWLIATRRLLSNCTRNWTRKKHWWLVAVNIKYGLKWSWLVCSNFRLKFSDGCIGSKKQHQRQHQRKTLDKGCGRAIKYGQRLVLFGLLWLRWCLRWCFRWRWR